MKVFLPMPDEAELADIATKGLFVPFDAGFLRRLAGRWLSELASLQAIDCRRLIADD